MALAVYDLKWMVLPDKLTYPLSLLAVFYMAVQAIAAEDFEVVVAAFISVMVLAGFFWLLFQVSDGKWIGGGDVKLAVPIALILGRPELALLALFAASLLGSLAAIPLMLAGKAKRNAQIPFGPFLIAAVIFTYLSGTDLISWYTANFIFL